MTSSKVIAIDELTLSWVKEMIRYLKICQTRFKENFLLSELLEREILQFTAIAIQLDMLLCTRPVNPWAKYFWRQNFAVYLSQIVRHSHHCWKNLADAG